MIVRLSIRANSPHSFLPQSWISSPPFSDTSTLSVSKSFDPPAPVQDDTAFPSMRSSNSDTPSFSFSQDTSMA